MSRALLRHCARRRCGAPFTTTRANVVYCSGACSKAAALERLRGQALNGSYERKVKEHIKTVVTAVDVENRGGNLQPSTGSVASAVEKAAEKPVNDQWKATQNRDTAGRRT